MILGMEIMEIAAFVVVWHIFEFLLLKLGWEILKELGNNLKELLHGKNLPGSAIST